MLGFIQNDGFYMIAFVIAMLAVSMSDNNIKSTIFGYSYDNNYELVYFDIQGKAQQIRYLFAYLDVDFVDRRLSNEEW